MKAIKRILVAVMCSAAAVSVFAESITLNWGSGQTFTFDTEDFPSEVVKIIKENQGKIETAIEYLQIKERQKYNYYCSCSDISLPCKDERRL